MNFKINCNKGIWTKNPKNECSKSKIKISKIIGKWQNWKNERWFDSDCRYLQNLKQTMNESIKIRKWVIICLDTNWIILTRINMITILLYKLLIIKTLILKEIWKHIHCKQSKDNKIES